MIPAGRTWGATELPPPRYPIGTPVGVVVERVLVPGVIVAAHWQAGARPWVRYLVDTGAWEWAQVHERAIVPALAAVAA